MVIGFLSFHSFESSKKIFDSDLYNDNIHNKPIQMTRVFQLNSIKKVNG